MALLGLTSAARAQTDPAQMRDLPDAPSALLAKSQPGDDLPEEEQTPSSSAPAQGEKTKAGGATPVKRPLLPPCRDRDYSPFIPPNPPGPPGPSLSRRPCREENPVQPFVTSSRSRPLTSKDKGKLAFKDFSDPFNFLTIAGYSAVAVAADSHSPYGPGFAGFGRLTGYSLAASAQVDFLEIYAIPSLVHEDPRYHRIPYAPFKRRLWHAIEHTYVSEHDDGRPMPNYATLLTYPITEEISDRYVPGIQTDIKSTAKRTAIGIATDPSGALVAEFLPDVARRVHIHIVFVQEILNRMVLRASSPETTTTAP